MTQTQKTDNLSDFIKETLEKNAVVVFMKGSKKFPMCGFSGAVVNIFNNLGVDFADFNMLEPENQPLRQAIKEYSNWPTLPQIYIKGEFIGGCDITREMFESGELQQMLKDKAVI